MSQPLPSYPDYKPAGLPWLAEVPAHWEVKRLKQVSRIVLGKMLKPSQTNEQEELKPYLRSVNVQWLKPKLTNVGEMWFSPQEMLTYRLNKGDVLVSEGGEVGRSCLWQEELEECYIQNAVYKVTCLKELQPGYLLYYFFTLGKSGYFESIVNRVSIAHLTREKLATIFLPLPPLPEQQNIIEFLDGKTRQIRRLINYKRHLIKLLNEQKQAIIQRTVTQGLNPSISLKVTGVSWLGEIPIHWNFAQLKRRWEVIDCKHLTVPFTEEGFPLASVREAQNFDIKLSKAKRTSEDYYCSLITGGRRPQRGDLIYCRNVSVGACAYVSTDEAFAMGQDVCLIRSSSENNRFLNYYLSSLSMKQQLAQILIGSTFNRINVSEIKSLGVVIPPRAEQDAICDYLDGKMLEFDIPIANAQREIELIQEYQVRLITDVVTGRVDVRHLADAASLPELPAELEMEDEEESEEELLIETEDGRD